MLLAAGTAPSVVDRTIAELEDHYRDLLDAESAAGGTLAAAERRAESLLGDLGTIASAVQQRPELKSWAWHWPRVAAVVYPLACIAVLPAAPVFAGVVHAPAVGRWLGGVVAAALVTAGMLFGLELSIMPG
ncbi:MAG TPA: hypothetical protein VFY03_09715 [Woeseiaceae bacterium]|nr:hypothetical protein [Woeseiaceae bacterium]